MRNTITYGTIERGAAEALGRRLPPAWSEGLHVDAGGATLLTLRATDGRYADLVVLSRKQVSPRDVANLVRQAGDNGRPFLVMAPFLSIRTRELLALSNVSYADATGNVRVVISEPAVFLEGQGAQLNPHKRPRPLRSLKGAAAGRVVRALCDFAPPYGVRMLADASSTPLSTVSRVVTLLEEEALLDRDAQKQVVSVDWPELLGRWVRDYGVTKSNVWSAFLEPRGLSALRTKLDRLPRYAVTGSIAGPSIAPARLAMIYVDDAAAASETLDLVATEAGANVWLLEPYNVVVFERTQMLPFAPSAGQVIAASPSQVVADLLTSPGRGPQEGKALIDNMKETEDAWRRKP